MKYPYITCTETKPIRYTLYIYTQVYGRGTGLDCRKHVQQLNTRRGELASLKEASSVTCPRADDDYDEENQMYDDAGVQPHLKNMVHQENMSVKCIPPHTPLKSDFYIGKLGYIGVYLFFLFLLQSIDCGYSIERVLTCIRNLCIEQIFAPKHRLWVLVRTASLRRF